MKSLFNITLLFLAGLLLQSSACKEKNDEPTEVETVCSPSNTAYMPSDARSRFFFREGSWWVYKNIANEELDTIKLEKCDRHVGKPPKELWGDIPGKCYEWAVIKFRSKKYDYHNVRIEFIKPKSGIDSTNEIYQIQNTYTYDAQVRTSYKFIYKGGNLYADQDSGYISHIDSIEIKSKMYHDILYYETQNLSDYITSIYYAACVGTIKMRRTDGTTWELVNSKIIQ